jgi:5-oxoprolinase (ATP-hydrolysing) subunit C
VGLLVITPGLCTTVQDLGRPGFRAWGVPVGGAFDLGSYALANALLGNAAGAAVLEFTLLGGIYEAETELAIALAGAPMRATIQPPEGAPRSLQIPQTATLAAGERLVLAGTPRGARTYLAVKGGWQTTLVLGSRSSEERLKPGDRLPAAASATAARVLTDFPGLPPLAAPIRVIDGPDARRWGGPSGWESLTFRVSPKSDRMGLRLAGPPIDVPADPERVSTPVSPGAVQVAGGQLIILGVACGTMGGYPHLAHAISADLDRLAQARPGDPVRFRRIDLHEARTIDRTTRAERAARLASAAALAAEPGEN